MELNCLKGTEPLQGDSIPLTTRCSGVPGTGFDLATRDS